VSSERIFPGQVYAACDPREEGMRIKVVGWPTGIGPGRVEVITISRPDDELDQVPSRRPRKIACSSLHADRLTFNGVRKTGYYLVVQNG
jgi:hypothetical protein